MTRSPTDMAGGGAAPLLEARGLALDYGRGPVLRNIDLTVRTGQLWFLLGPNGAGKSTLLRAVLQTLRPRAGTLRLAAELDSCRRVGFVPQRCDLRPTLPMRVCDFVTLGLVGTRVGRRAADDNLRWALHQVGLVGLRNADYWELSGGQRQRALVARGLIRRPRLLVLDEPTTGLDATSEARLLRTVEDLHRDVELAIIVVTHTVALAARHATHVALLSGGSGVLGRREEVLTPARLREAYGVVFDPTWSPLAVRNPEAEGGEGPRS